MKILKNRPVVIGTRQSLKQLSADAAELVILAEDTDRSIADEIRKACREHQVPVRLCPSKKQLGIECGISRDAAVITVLKNEPSAMRS